ncbi:PEP-CTERM sorting domain-containing protein [bacterium]|nr:MAG: PEP-CTERM sorting domain-containing protein [bacterium]
MTGSGGFAGPGKVQFDGGYAPGSFFGSRLASVAFEGDLALGATNALTMELGGTSPGTGYDRLTVGGLATLGGSLNVVRLSDFALAPGQSFDLFDFSLWNGQFSSVNLPTLGSDLKWDTSTLYANGTIRVQSVPEPTTVLSLSLGALALLRRKRAAAKKAA